MVAGVIDPKSEGEKVDIALIRLRWYYGGELANVLKKLREQQNRDLQVVRHRPKTYNERILEEAEKVPQINQ